MPNLISRIQSGRRAAKRGLRSFRKKLSKPTVRVVAVVIAWVYRGYMSLVWRTSRVEYYGIARTVYALKKHRNIALAVWHDNVGLAPRGYRELRLTTLASQSDIGEVITAVLKLQGHHVFRGGSSRGKSRRAPVLKQLIQYVKERQEVMLALTVDGSAGPARVLKSGIIALARDTGAPIFAVHFSCKPVIKARSWDRTRFPLPFGRIVIVTEGPILIKKDRVNADEFRRLREQTQLLLDDTARRADHCLLHGDLPPPDPALDLDPSYGDRDRRVGPSLFLPHEPRPNSRPIGEA